MALNEKKAKIFDKIKLYQAMANSDVDLKAYEKYISASNDPIQFLLTVLKVSQGENAIEALTEYTLSKIITQKSLDGISNKFFDFFEKKIPENLAVPQNFSNPGLKIPIKSFDFTNSFRRAADSVSTASEITNKLFTDFKDNVLPKPNLDFSIGLPGINTNLILNYDENNNEANIKLSNSISAKELFVSLQLYIGPLFDARVIHKEIINLLFHTDFTDEDAQLYTTIRSYTQYEATTGFKLDLKKLLNYEDDVQKGGYKIDMGCFMENVTLTPDQITEVLNKPSTSTYQKLIPNYGTNGDEIMTNNKTDFFKKLISAIIDAILAMFIKQPIVMFFVNLISKILNFDFDLTIDNIDLLFKKLGNFFEQLFDSIYEELICVIFNYIKRVLIKLVLVITIKLVKEQLEKRQKILLSLTGGRFSNIISTI